MATCLHPIRLHTGEIRPCQKCPVCRQNQRQSRADRFYIAGGFCYLVYFVTLTYSDDQISYALPPNVHEGPWLPCFDYVEIRNFKQRLDRENLKYKSFITFEYGEEFHRPHYHCLFFVDTRIEAREMDNLIFKCWNGSITQTLLGNDALEAYACGYVLKDDLYAKNLPGQIFSIGVDPNFPQYPNKRCDKWDVRYPRQLYDKGIGKNSIEWLNEYIYNDGNIREYLELGKKRVSFDRYIKNNIDPSLKAELDARRQERQDEIEKRLEKSKLANSWFDSEGIPHNDYTRDAIIMKHRLELKKLKKTLKK